MSSTKKTLIFIVDDDPMHTQMLEDHLKDKYDFDIRSFTTGESCVDNMNSRPDIVILDFHLNSVDSSARNGAEILQFIKAEYPETEVIMLSGQDKINVAVETMKYGASDYVIKNESGFVRVQYAIDRIFDSVRLQERMLYYKNLSRVWIAAFFVIVIVAIILSALNVI